MTTDERQAETASKFNVLTGIERNGAEMNRHTPGPWVLKFDQPTPDYEFPYMTLTAGDPYPEDGPAGFNITGILREPDARLIAAAPEMHSDGVFLLDRLDDFEREIQDDDLAREWSGHVGPAIARFRAAIEKAAPSLIAEQREVKS